MPRDKLNRDELGRVGLYFELLQRYQNLPAPKMLPLLAVRTLCIRRGYDGVMGIIGRWGADVAVNYARDELRDMARLWAYMITQDPPPDDKREGVLNSIKLTRDAGNNADVIRNMYQILGRCHIREVHLRQKKNTPDPKRSTPRMH